MKNIATILAGMILPAGVNVMLDDPTGTVLNGYQLPGVEATGFRSGTFMYEYKLVGMIDGEFR